MATYSVDGPDKVLPLDGIPQSSVGAPQPVVLGDDHGVVVAYIVSNVPADWDGTTVRVVGKESEGEPIALVTFRRCQAAYFGAPNDEAFAGHPLADRGLRPYGSYEVKPSSWIAALERMNSVHTYHDPARFDRLRHIALTFHDSMFECVADSFEVETHVGSIRSIMPRMLELLWSR